MSILKQQLLRILSYAGQPDGVFGVWLASNQVTSNPSYLQEAPP